jgi:hypothetical protein
MSHGGFSHAAHERTAQTSSAMRRDNDQIGAFPCSRFVYGAGAVSGNRRGIDRNAVETNALQESFDLVATSAPRCFDVTGRIVLAMSRGHHNRAETSDVDDDDARTKLFRELPSDRRRAPSWLNRSYGVAIRWHTTAAWLCWHSIAA